MLRYFDGFEYIPAAAQGAAQTRTSLNAAGYYFRPNGIGGFLIPQVTTGRFAYGKCLAVFYQFTGGFYTSADLVKPLGGGATLASAVVGVAVHLSSDATNSCYVGLWDSAGGEPQISVAFLPMGVVQVWRGTPGSGTLLASSEIGTFNVDAWFFAEVKALIDPTVGTVEVRLNAKTTVINLTGANTQATGRALFDGFILGSPNVVGTTNYAFDDFYLCDLTGGVNDDFLGNVRTQELITNGPGATTDLSIGGSAPAPTNWQSVHDFTLDEAQFVSAAADDDFDLYTVTPMVNTPPIYGVQVRGAMRQDDATEIGGQNLISSAGTIAAGAVNDLTETQAYYTDIFETDPATGLGWLPAAVNAAQIGPKRKAA